MVEVLCEWVVDDSYRWFSVDGEAERDGYVVVCVHEVGCPVDWVDDECGALGYAAGGGSGLFAEETVVWRRWGKMSEEVMIERW